MCVVYTISYTLSIITLRKVISMCEWGFGEEKKERRDLFEKKVIKRRQKCKRLSRTIFHKWYLNLFFLQAAPKVEIWNSIKKEDAKRKEREKSNRRFDFKILSFFMCKSDLELVESWLVDIWRFDKRAEKNVNGIKRNTQSAAVADI